MLNVTKSLCFLAYLFLNRHVLYTTHMDSKILSITTWLGSGSINLFGMPFAGKDTQGKILQDYLQAELIAGGEILRSYNDQEKLQQIMATGKLLPSDLYLEIVLPFLSKPELTGKPLILDSVGRHKGEEEVILEATAGSGHPTKVVLMLELTEDEVWRRFNAAHELNDREGRADDSKEALVVRLEQFRLQTQPVIDYYKSNNLLLSVDGSLPREDVTQQIIEALYSLALKTPTL